MLNLKFRDIIIIKLFKRCMCNVYRLGLKDEFNYENQKCIVMNKNLEGCSKAVQIKNSKCKNQK